jgi:hypothetical protein
MDLSRRRYEGEITEVNMKRLIILVIISFSAFGETNILVAPRIEINGVSYTNATLRKLNPTTVILHYDGGIGSAAITNLPEPYQSRFYDAAEIAEAEKIARWNAQVKADEAKRRAQQRAQASKELQKEQSKERFDVRIDSVRADGFLGTRIAHEPIYGEYQKPHVDRMTRIGAGSSSPGAGIGYRPIIGHEDKDLNPVFVINGPKDVADGKTITIRARKIGTKKIDSRTIEEWDAR